MIRSCWRGCRKPNAPASNRCGAGAGENSPRRQRCGNSMPARHADIAPDIAMDQTQFLDAALQNPVNRLLADELLRLKLPDAWIVSGCLVQSVWNVRTGRAVDYGIADYDVFYFDHDVSWQAEDAVIRRLQESFATSGVEA